MRDRILRWLIAATSWLTAWLYSLQRVPVWRSFDGRVTPISKMTDDHLKNTVRMLARNSDKTGEPLPPAYSFLLRELTTRHARRREDTWPP